MSHIPSAVLFCILCFSTSVPAAQSLDDDLPDPSDRANNLPIDDPAITATCEQIVDSSTQPEPENRQQQLNQCIADAQQFLNSVKAGD